MEQQKIYIQTDLDTEKTKKSQKASVDALASKVVDTNESIVSITHFVEMYIENTNSNVCSCFCYVQIKKK